MPLVKRRNAVAAAQGSAIRNHPRSSGIHRRPTWTHSGCAKTQKFYRIVTKRGQAGLLLMFLLGVITGLIVHTSLTKK